MKVGTKQKKQAVRTNAKWISSEKQGFCEEKQEHKQAIMVNKQK